jgi:hypothetical protein
MLSKESIGSSGNKLVNQNGVSANAFNPSSAFVLTQPYHTVVRDGYFEFSLRFSATTIVKEFKVLDKACRLNDKLVVNSTISCGDVLEFARAYVKKAVASKVENTPKDKTVSKLRPQSSLCDEDFGDNLVNFNERIKEVALKIGTASIGRIRQMDKIQIDTTVESWWKSTSAENKLQLVTDLKYRSKIVEIENWQQKLSVANCPFRGKLELVAVKEKVQQAPPPQTQ